MITPSVLSLLTLPFESLTSMEQAVAIRSARLAGYEQADEEIRVRSIHAGPYPATEESYAEAVVTPARQNGIISDEERETWGNKLGLGEAIGDPRIQSFLSAMSERIAVYRSEHADQAHQAIARWLGRPMNAVRPNGVLHNSFVVFAAGEGVFFAVPENSDPFVPDEDSMPEPMDELLRDLGDDGHTYYSRAVGRLVTRSTLDEMAVYEVHEPMTTH